MTEDRTTLNFCVLCDHCYLLDEHHLHPACDGAPRRGPKVYLCRLCHKMIHRLFTNRQLHFAFNTVEELRNAPIVQQRLLGHAANKAWAESPRKNSVSVSPLTSQSVSASPPHETVLPPELTRRHH